tara:strand:+ start:2044 stop:2544 length:501 start_codon:yes stop_codon:yes gene_type:complete
MPYVINNEIGIGKVTTIELWPYNSLKPKGFAFFVGATFALIALPLFNVLGTKVFWGLFPFLFLTFIGIWFALRKSLRDRQILEQLTLYKDELVLIRQDPNGEQKEWVCSTYWSKLRMYDKEGPVANYITLSGNGREVELGSFLGEDERKELFHELNRLLKKLNRNP